MRCAVVGHVEWVEFVRVPHMPAPGQIVHARDLRTEPAGGGAVVARQLALLAGRCELFTALGADELGRHSARRLAELGVDVHAQWRGQTRRAWVHVDEGGERAITVLGDKLLPLGPIPLHGFDAVFFVAGDVAALRAAREASFVAATLRELPTLKEGNIPLDLLVGSASDPSERYDESLQAANVVLTEGAHGGVANGERFQPAPAPAPVVDTYGAGDSFAAALCFALARGDDLAPALELAARAGAAVLGGHGPYETQLRRPR